MTYDKPDYNHYVSLGDCPNCRHGLMWMNHNGSSSCFFCGYSEKGEGKQSIPNWFDKEVSK